VKTELFHAGIKWSEVVGLRNLREYHSRVAVDREQGWLVINRLRTGGFST